MAAARAGQEAMVVQQIEIRRAADMFESYLNRNKSFNFPTKTALAIAIRLAVVFELDKMVDDAVDVLQTRVMKRFDVTLELSPFINLIFDLATVGMLTKFGKLRNGASVVTLDSLKEVMRKQKNATEEEEAGEPSVQEYAKALTEQIKLKHLEHRAWEVPREDYRMRDELTAILS